jgi:glycine cleavage system transcriptional repressor
MSIAYAVVRAIGSDRVGVVDDITTVVEQAGCNIEESKMSVLGGEFAVMMLVSGTGEAVEALGSHSYAEGPLADFSVDVVRTGRALVLKTGVPYVIESVSLDSPGIVHAVTALLAREKINIEELETGVGSAPFTGSKIFRMRICITVDGPKRASLVREALNRLAFDRDIDIRFSSLASAGSAE